MVYCRIGRKSNGPGTQRTFWWNTSGFYSVRVWHSPSLCTEREQSFDDLTYKKGSENRYLQVYLTLLVIQEWCYGMSFLCLVEYDVISVITLPWYVGRYQGILSAISIDRKGFQRTVETTFISLARLMSKKPC